MKVLSLIIFSSLLFAAAPTNKLVTLGEAQPKTLKSLEKAEFSIPIEIEPGFHIQANPASEKRLIPTTLKLQSSGVVTLQEPIYPAGKPFKLKTSEQEISTYDHKIVIRVPISVKEVIRKRKVTLLGTLRYQACDSQSCFFPTTIEVKIPLTLEP